jgi:hypothetical protein
MRQRNQGCGSGIRDAAAESGMGSGSGVGRYGGAMAGALVGALAALRRSSVLDLQEKSE